MTIPTDNEVEAVARAMKQYYPNGGDDWGFVSERDTEKEVTGDLGSWDAANIKATELNARSAIAAMPKHNAWPEGWKLVPIEPTEAMRVAGGHWLDNDNAGAHMAWDAMIIAAPSPPTP